mgnify:CR=1 FL=1
MENIALTEGVYYILLSLLEPMHGYGIMQNIEKMSDGRVHMAAGTLYGALNTLQEKGWIRALEGENTGRQHELCRLQELVKNGEERLGGV